MKTYSVAVVGAMGAVGTEIMKILEERNFPIEAIKPLDVGANVGKEIVYNGRAVKVGESKAGAFGGVDIAFLAVGAEISRFLAPMVSGEGAIVIDNSSAWRMETDVPLVVPEVNPEALFDHHGIIANPNCSTIIAMLPLKPLHEHARIKRAIVSTYQAVSGAGIPGLDELRTQTRRVLDGDPIEPSVFSHQIAFNLIPQIDAFEPNGYTHEEMKMLNEGRKILACPDLMVNCTCIRVPVFRSHSESITIETERKLTPDQARKLLAAAPGVKLVDDPDNRLYPMPLDTTGQDLVFVGRIREDISTDGNALTLWCCADQIRKGAALNAVQIAEKLVEMQIL